MSYLNTTGMDMNMQTGNGEDLMTLEQEITELQRENARVESQMIRLKSDINAMETHLSHGERVSCHDVSSVLGDVSESSSLHNNLSMIKHFVDGTVMAPNIQL